MVGSETTFGKLKKGLLELVDGYPDYMFFGKIEYFLGTRETSIKVLAKDGIIQLASKKEEQELNKKLTQQQLDLLKKEGKTKPDYWYRLTAKGVDLANSMMGLQQSGRVLYYAQETHKFNRWIKWLTIGLFSIGITQLLLTYFQNPLW